MTTEIVVLLSRALGVLQVVERELLLFACFWFIISALDELIVDLVWIYLRLSGRGAAGRLPAGVETRPLSGRIAVLVPAWQEAEVIGAMVAHTLKAWPQTGLRLYVGCYCNDAATLQAALAGASGDTRFRLVVHGNRGPTTKADCLNRLYAALCDDEARSDIVFTGVLLHVPRHYLPGFGEAGYTGPFRNDIGMNTPQNGPFQGLGSDMGHHREFLARSGDCPGCNALAAAMKGRNWGATSQFVG